MTEREQMALAYGLLFGAADGAAFVKKDGVRHLLIAESVVHRVLALLEFSGDLASEEERG